MDLGPHAAYVWLAYLAVAGALVLFLAWLVIDGRRQQRLAEDLEARGVRRRSARPEPSPQ